MNAILWMATLTHYPYHCVSVEELSGDSCPVGIWCFYNKYLPKKQSFKGKYASFKNIKFPRSNCQIVPRHDTVYLWMNTIAACDQFKPIGIRENVVVNTNVWQCALVDKMMVVSWHFQSVCEEDLDEDLND